jgi:SAM-dependent methyltransferase
MSYYRDIVSHRGMLSDRIRMQAYRQAIHAMVREGDVVADLGTGTGILAFFAVQAGARKVYAIEREETIFLAEKLAQHNGMADRIVFIKGSSDEVDLPEPVDVITSELIGPFALDEGLLPYIVDFRDRWLKPGGTLVPAWLELYLAPVESPELWDTTVGLWGKDFYGLDFSAVRSEGFSERYATDCLGKIRRLAPESAMARLDFYTVTEVPQSFGMRMPLGATGTMHGYVGYFKVGVSPQVVLSTSPDEPPTHWLQSFFPLPKPVEVQAGDILAYEVRTFSMGREFWKWDTNIMSQGGQSFEFSQSDFQISRDELLINSNNYVPHLALKGEIQKTVLEACNGHRTIPEIAEELQKAYPEPYQDTGRAIAKTKEILMGKVVC